MTEETKAISTVKEEKSIKRYRLLTTAQMHGAVREPGYVFTLEDGEKGPHRTVVASSHGAQITDHINSTQELKDVPLYEEVKEPDPAPAKDAVKISPEHEHDKGRIATLEGELADKNKQLGEAHAKLDAVSGALKAAPASDDKDFGKPLLLEPPTSNLPPKS